MYRQDTQKLAQEASPDLHLAAAERQQEQELLVT